MSRRTVYITGVLSLAVWALALAGCAGIPGGHTLTVQPSAVQLQAIRGERDDATYFPEYELYYSGNRELCVYHYNYGWRVQARPTVRVAAMMLRPTNEFLPTAIYP